MSSPHPTRADRRRATEARILAGARELFAEKGFDRTTIRAVAAAAGVDPALVMQHFGSKRGLFTRAVQSPPRPPAPDAPEELVEHLLATLGLKLGGLPEGAVAMLRSMLTDPAAADHVRTALDGQIAGLAAAMPTTEDAELRAALAVTALLGITIGHQFLRLAPLRDAPPETVAALLRPPLTTLTHPSPTPPTADPGP